ncbi:MAG TPA: condensation domain-containing protein, partial [Opitutaceae bacterium]|nr:condensation domain-containing protein [Opitutaceae bacterium]
MSHPHDIPDDEQLFDLLLDETAAGSEPTQSTMPASKGEDGTLSNFQQRLWLVQQMDPSSTAYIMPFYLRLCGTLDKSALQRALQLLWRRHTALRTIYPAQDGLPRCAHLPADSLDLHEFDLSSAPDRWRDHYLTTVFGPMNLEKGPLVRATLYQISPEEHVLLIEIHHLNGDGASLA